MILINQWAKGRKLVVMLLGKEARLHAILMAIIKSSRAGKPYVVSEVNNPGLAAHAELILGETNNCETIAEHVRRVKPDFVIIGPEEPLEAGVVDMLRDLGIPCVGPTQSLARIETSKSFTRRLLEEYEIPGNPEHKIFSSLEGIEPYVRGIGPFVVKPDGLTGGKGVKVFGEHLQSVDDALAYCKNLFDEGPRPVLIEERLDGEEFTLQSLCDGDHIIDTVVSQDHKRAFEDDTGPNTGGMGSYSCEDHSLPFLTDQIIRQASEINRAVAKALRHKTGEGYKGILYGGFMATAKGLKLIEYNARFGDPEAMNVLPLLKTDFIDVCEAIIAGTLDKIKIQFENKATVCKYIVPEGYPLEPAKGKRIDISNLPQEGDNLRIFYAAIDKRADGLYLTGSRALAVVGIGANLEQAEQVAEEAASRVRGPVFHRRDIGSRALIEKRVNHMKSLIAKKGRLAVDDVFAAKIGSSV